MFSVFSAFSDFSAVSTLAVFFGRLLRFRRCCHLRRFRFGGLAFSDFLAVSTYAVFFAVSAVLSFAFSADSVV